MANPGRCDSFFSSAVMTVEELLALEREPWVVGQAAVSSNNLVESDIVANSVETAAGGINNTWGGENVAADVGGCYVVAEQQQWNFTMQQQQQHPDMAAQLTERLIDYQLRGGGDQQLLPPPPQLMAGPPPPPPPSATSANPTMVKWPGRYGFSIGFRRLSKSTKNKGWDFSFELNKLFIDMGKDVMMSFRLTAEEEERMALFVRATPIYAVASHLQEPVVRCPNHASADHPSNKGLPFDRLFHLIRTRHDEAAYHRDPDSGRLSVRVPMKRPHEGAVGQDVPVKFMCLGSDAGGMNRRPVKVIFTLETEEGEVAGRQNVDVRVCSCPKRDRAQEEKRAAKGTKQARQMASQLAKQTSLSFRKTNSFVGRDDDTILVPICKQDKELMQQLVEGMACRANQSRRNRRRLLEACHRGEKAVLKREPTTDW